MDKSYEFVDNIPLLLDSRRPVKIGEIAVNGAGQIIHSLERVIHKIPGVIHNMGC